MRRVTEGCENAMYGVFSNCAVRKITISPLYLIVIAVLQLACVSSVGAENSPVWVGQFSKGSLAGWQEESFVGHTTYQLRETEQGQTLHAKAQGQASAMFREIRVDLDKTPYLHWSWRVDNIITDNDELTKEGDDYPARIYVVVSGGAFYWRTYAVNYVWSSHQQTGSQWPNAYTENAQMMALRSGVEQLGQWVQEKQNVREDFRRLFGKDISHIDAVALMVDADDTLQSATASFGDIYFSAN